MIKYLIQTQTTIRVETEDDANQLHKEIEQFAHSENYILLSWTQTYKCRKQKSEIIDKYLLCRYILQFNDVKEPEILLKDIQYNMGEERSFNA